MHRIDRNDGLTIGSAGTWRAAIRRNQLSAFFVLAFLFSWYPWIIAIARNKTSGPNPIAPLIAAVVVSAIVNGWPGMRDLLGRIVRIRFGSGWYVLIFGLPFAFCAIAMAIMTEFGQRVSLPAAAAWRELPDRFLLTFLFIGLGEEPGWRGFALPRLQGKSTPLMASLILAPIWALWHLPLMGNEFPAPVIPAFLISLLGGTLIQTALFNRTRGSVFAQMLFHATVNTVGAGLVFPLYQGANLILFWYVHGFLWLAVGIAAQFTGSIAAGAEVCSEGRRNAGRSGPDPRPDRT